MNNDNCFRQVTAHVKDFIHDDGVELPVSAPPILEHGDFVISQTPDTLQFLVWAVDFYGLSMTVITAIYVRIKSTFLLSGSSYKGREACDIALRKMLVFQESEYDHDGVTWLRVVQACMVMRPSSGCLCPNK